MIETLFRLALGLVAFSYLGYPLVLAVRDGVREALAALRFVGGGPDRRARGAPAEASPRVTLAFAAFDEEACPAQHEADGARTAR